MPLTESDIQYFASANMPENNSSTSGGAIDLTTKVLFTDISTTDNVTVKSDNAGDVSAITITGRLASGIIDNEILTLTGTTRVVGSKNFERILKVEMSSDPSGIVVVTRDNSPTYTNIASLSGTIKNARRLFYDSGADVSGGSSRDFYEKVFVKNTHSTLALTNAVINEYSDPSGMITFDLEDAKNDTNSVASRLNTSPTGMLSSFSGSSKSVPGTYLGAGESIGTWLKLTVAAGASPGKSTYTIRLTGNST